MQKSDCFLCGDLAERGGRIELGHELALTADLSPLAPGHILLHTKGHIPSFAGLPSFELSVCYQTILRLAASPPLAGREFLLFEHGTDGVQSVDLGCTDHAHIHILPLPRTLEGKPAVSAVAAANAVPNQSGVTIDFHQLGMLRGTSYFWVSNPELSLQIITPVDPERQFLRGAIARAIGRHQHHTWDLYNPDAARIAIEAWRGTLSIETGVQD